MSTEEKILEAAEVEFMTKGYDGARMRSIAEMAEINKGLLHYYFKSKEALMVRVFQRTFHQLFASLAEALRKPQGIPEKIRGAVSAYTDFMLEHPRLPMFILFEMNRDPKKHHERMRKANSQPPFKPLFEAMEAAKERGEVRADLQPKLFMMTMMSLLLFPMVSKPMITYIHDISDAEYKRILISRKEEVTDLLIHYIQPKNK